MREPQRHAALHPELDLWRSNVGDVVALDRAEPVSNPGGLLVLSWNLAVGKAHLGDVVRRIRTRAPDTPLVLLVQEAYRTDLTVPELHRGHHHGGLHPLDKRQDIVEAARELGLALRYAPSMRNGPHRSDRGNAILATHALTDAHAFILPHARQRRVVVTAKLDGLPGLRFASAHLDTRRSFRRPRRGNRVVQAVDLARQLEHETEAIILGADLNSYLGVLDPTVRTLLRAGFHLARREGRWRHTFHTPQLRLLLDHVLYRSATPLSISVRRLDERERDAGPTVFGSDHHPLLATVTELNA